jgi:hypothetical protein
MPATDRSLCLKSRKPQALLLWFTANSWLVPMKSKSNFAHSLLLAITASSVAPLVLLTIVCLSFQLCTYVPGIGEMGAWINRGIAAFLMDFGNGSPVQGMLTISLVCGLVGGLFDTYAFYSFPSHRE